MMTADTDGHRYEVSPSRAVGQMAGVDMGGYLRLRMIAPVVSKAFGAHRIYP